MQEAGGWRPRLRRRALDSGGRPHSRCARASRSTAPGGCATGATPSWA